MGLDRRIERDFVEEIEAQEQLRRLLIGRA